MIEKYNIELSSNNSFFGHRILNLIFQESIRYTLQFDLVLPNIQEKLVQLNIGVYFEIIITKFYLEALRFISYG